MGRPVKTVYLPQFAEDSFSRPAEDGDVVDADLFPPDRLNLMFAGNVGAAQSVETLVHAAAELAGEPFMFHVVGSGTKLNTCKALARELGLSNIIFHGRYPIETMPAYYAKADAMVATFADSPVLGLTLPRKIQSYMAAGKPVIGTVTGEAMRVLGEADCGFCCEAENVEGLVDCCRRMALASSGERARYGESARRYCAEHYSRDSFFETLTEALEALKGTKHGK